MTRETLKKANNYITQISKLNNFVKTCRNCWKIIRLKHPKFKVITAYGALSDEIEVSEELLERAKILLKATHDILQKQKDSPFVLDILCQTAIWDGVECDGYCLYNDIETLFEEMGESLHEK